MKPLLYRRLRSHERPPCWMAFGCYRALTDQILWVAFPLNLAVALAWRIQDLWARAARSPSWIEQEVVRRIAARDRILRPLHKGPQPPSDPSLN